MPSFKDRQKALVREARTPTEQERRKQIWEIVARNSPRALAIPLWAILIDSKKTISEIAERHKSDDEGSK